MPEHGYPAGPNRLGVGLYQGVLRGSVCMRFVALSGRVCAEVVCAVWEPSRAARACTSASRGPGPTSVCRPLIRARTLSESCESGGAFLAGVAGIGVLPQASLHGLSKRLPPSARARASALNAGTWGLPRTGEVARRMTRTRQQTDSDTPEY
jgi:hypothetical protein